MTDSFRLEVTYAPGNVNVHPGLTEEQLYDGVGAFVRDLAGLRGRGVKRLVIAREQRCEHGVDTAHVTCPLCGVEHAHGDLTYAPPLGLGRRVYECEHQRFILPCREGCHDTELGLERQT